MQMSFVSNFSFEFLDFFWTLDFFLDFGLFLDFVLDFGLGACTVVSF
jgi:hypothetical protein